MSEGTAWCLPVDLAKNIRATPIPISYDASTTIAVLQTKLKEGSPNLLKDADACEVIVLRSTEKLLSCMTSIQELAKIINKLDFSDETKVYTYGPGVKVTSLGLAEDEVLLFKTSGNPRADVDTSRPSKRPRLEAKSDSLDFPDPFLQAVYNILWHKRYPEGVEPFDPFQEVSVPPSSSEDGGSGGTPESRTVKVLDLTPLKKLASRFAYPSCRLLIRQSYEELRDELLNIEETTNYQQFVFLLGHDGVVYTRLGGSARTCLIFGDWQRQELSAQNFAIPYTANSGGRDLEALVLHHSEHRDFWDSLIATVIPGQNEDGSFDRSRATTSFASTYVASAVIRQASTEVAGRIFSYYESECKYLPLSRAAAALAFEGFVHRVLANGFRRAKIRALRSKDNLNAPATRGGWEFVDFSADPDANEPVYGAYENRFKLTPRDHLCCDFKVHPSLILDGDRHLNLFQIASDGLFGFNADCLEHMPPGQRDKIHRLIFVVPEKGFDSGEGMARMKQSVSGRNQEYYALATKIPQYLLLLTDEDIRKSI
ncbi:hypothetical protein EST38_g3641 [Candolleomyces aberdarensis]|uniref:Uncharacterized protein n=1 Tax=Candolleomyces aberdarensis TaxID=2316362 RepID=A0A4Q2DQ36_9AGAR|nr:hypothetical protein EST38_g3641 [Candolleomyces aberdarensis]